MVVQEERLAVLADRQMRRLAGGLRERANMTVAQADQAAAAVLARETPGGRAEDVLLAAVGICEEPSLPQGVCQPEDIAAVDAQQRRQVLERHRDRGLTDGFKN